MTHRRRAAALAALLLALVAAGAAPAQATDDQVTWSVQPAGPDGPDGRTELTYTVAPGTTLSDRISVSNYSAGPATFRVYAADATTDPDTGAFTLIGADQASTDLGGWTAVDSGPAVCPDTGDQAETDCVAGLGVTVTVEAGARVDLPFTVTIPHDATPGDHAAGIVASVESTATDSSGSAVRVAQRVGTRMHLRVDGPLHSELGVSGAVAGYHSGWNPLAGGDGRVDLDLTNTGNTRLTATPQIHLTGPFGLDLGELQVAPVTDLLPGSTAHVRAAAPVPPWLLLFADIQVDGVAAGGLPAPAADPVTLTLRTWAVPWSALGLLVLVAGAITAVVLIRRRARRRLGEDLAAYTERIRAEALADAAVPTESESLR